MTIARMKESGNVNGLPSLFSFILARSESHISRKSYEKRISHHVELMSGYRKANQSQMTVDQI